ncbi:MAG: helix-turn-helix domain-containing protein [Pyrinomonadaceae bacterium]
MEQAISQAPARSNRKATPTKPAVEPTETANQSLATIPASTPTYKSFEHVRDPKARRAKDYEQHLLILRDMFPQFIAGIDEQIAYARSQSGRDQVSDRDRIIRHLEKNGQLTCREMSEDLNIPYATCYKILRSYLELGTVAAHERKGIAGNKPYLVYSITPTQA